jgi:hypothetical protein
LNQPLLMDSYPRAPDGAVEIPREQMNRDDVRFAVSKFKSEATEAYTRAYELERWWREKRRAERAATG